MKKKPFKKTRKILGQIINVKYWSDWDRMKSSSMYLWRGVLRLFIPDTAEAKSSFDSAQARWNLSDKDLLERQKSLFRLSVLMAVVSAFIFIYSVYHLLSGNIAAFFLSLVVSCIALVLAFRYHYWHYLIKSRKLSCTLREWYQQGLTGERNE